MRKHVLECHNGNSIHYVFVYDIVPHLQEDEILHNDIEIYASFF